VYNLAGVATNDMWRWNGTAWAKLNPTLPPFRELHAMAYDAARHVVVLFGGAGGGAMGYLADTWTWDGFTWSQRFPPNAPAPRREHHMAFDAKRGNVVLFGGYDSSVRLLNDTWTWDGTTWTNATPQSPAPSPQPRTDGALAYDPHRERVVLF